MPSREHSASLPSSMRMYPAWRKGDPMPLLHTSALNRPPTINRGATTTDPEQARDRTRRPRRVPVLWPWVLVAAAWAVLVLATLTHQTFLLDHHYLLQASGL